MLDQGSFQYPNVFRFIQIILSTPPNTLLVEWEYTDLQMVAAERKNHLSKENLKTPVLLDALKLLAKNIPETLKYWVGVQQSQSYLMGRRCLFNLVWPPF